MNTVIVSLVSSSFASENLPSELGLALCEQESNFDPNVTNMGPGDAERGGSYGLFQMSLATAKTLGFQGQGEELHNPILNCFYAAKLTSQNARILGTHDVAKLAAAHNCGTTHVLQNTIPDSTKNEYVPRVLRFAEQWKK